MEFKTGVILTALVMSALLDVTVEGGNETTTTLMTVAPTGTSSSASSSSSSATSSSSKPSTSAAGISSAPIAGATTTIAPSPTTTFKSYNCSSGRCNDNNTCVPSSVCTVSNSSFGCYRKALNATEFEYGCRECKIEENEDDDWCCFEKKDCKPNLSKSRGGATMLSSCMATIVTMATCMATFIRWN